MTKDLDHERLRLLASRAIAEQELDVRLLKRGPSNPLKASLLSFAEARLTQMRKQFAEFQPDVALAVGEWAPRELPEPVHAD